MILNFRPSDMNTFRANFNRVEIVIHKQPDNSWKMFADGKPVKNGHQDTARMCMDVAERSAEKVINKTLNFKG